MFVDNFAESCVNQFETIYLVNVANIQTLSDKRDWSWQILFA